MKDKLIKIGILLGLIITIIISFMYYCMYITPTHISIDNQTISSEKIPKSLDNITISYFSDIHYGEFVDEERFDNIINKVKNTNPDIIIFGGDLFHNPSKFAKNTKVINHIKEKFKSLKAPLGKFYVLGDKDCINDGTKTMISNLLYNANFENITNRNINIHNKTIDSIKLIGVDNILNGKPNIKKAFNQVDSKTFNLVITHTPDNFINIPKDQFELGIAGHSFGGQINIPIYGSIYSEKGCEKYIHGNYHEGSAKITISNGVGTTHTDMRMFANAEITTYRLISTK